MTVTIEQAVYERLQIIPGLAAVGSRIHLDHRPQSETGLPAIEYEVPDLDTPSDLDGATGTASATITIRALSLTVAEAEALSLAIFRDLAGKSGDWSGIQVDYCTLDDQSSDWANDPDGSDQGVYIIETDYLVSHSMES